MYIHFFFSGVRVRVIIYSKISHCTLYKKWLGYSNRVNPRYTCTYIFFFRGVTVVLSPVDIICSPGLTQRMGPSSLWERSSRLRLDSSPQGAVIRRYGHSSKRSVCVCVCVCVWCVCARVCMSPCAKDWQNY